MRDIRSFPRQCKWGAEGALLETSDQIVVSVEDDVQRHGRRHHKRSSGSHHKHHQKDKQTQRSKERQPNVEQERQIESQHGDDQRHCHHYKHHHHRCRHKKSKGVAVTIKKAAAGRRPMPATGKAPTAPCTPARPLLPTSRIESELELAAMMLQIRAGRRGPRRCRA